MAVLFKRNDPEARGRAEAELIEAVVALLTDGTPYASLSVSKIAERAGHTRTGFYSYFRDKRDLLMSATSRLVEEPSRTPPPGWKDPGAAPTYG
ncbi:MAG: TetR/AcrR family transcriptional regulator [Solirubrobacteraceae bacterium]